MSFSIFSYILALYFNFSHPIHATIHTENYNCKAYQCKPVSLGHVGDQSGGPLSFATLQRLNIQATPVPICIILVFSGMLVRVLSPVWLLRILFDLTLEYLATVIFTVSSNHLSISGSQSPSDEVAKGF